MDGKRHWREVSMEPYPLKFAPIYKDRIWGGTKLRDVFGRTVPAGRRNGESWELADLPDDKSVIINGTLCGLTLAEAIKKHPGLIAGRASFEGHFPLLVKFIDAGEVLSVQVHPDEDACRRMGKGDPKTECWYVVAADQGAVLYKGLKRGTTRESFARAVEKGDVEKLLDKAPVAVGQCHYLPAGTPHAIGAGLLLAEIQTPSDTTYRVFDWNRLDDAGKPRPLHIEEALESIHFDVGASDLPVTTIGRLAESEYFTIDKGHQAAGCELLLSGGKPRLLMFLSGGAAAIAKNGATEKFSAGNCTLIPAAYEGAAVFEADTEYLTVGGF